MLFAFPIISGTHAGRAGPTRPTAGCECFECQQAREQRNERLRERYAEDPDYAERMRQRRAAVRAVSHPQTTYAGQRGCACEPCCAARKRAAERRRQQRNT